MEIKRDAYLQQLTLRKDNGMIKVITGIRRCGKSFLLFTIFKRYLLENGVDVDHIIEIALDGIENEELRDPKVCFKYIKDAMKDDGKYYLLLDEVQFMSQFEEVLNSLLRMSNIDVYVTGSNSKFLSSDIVTEFRGRGDEIRIYPLSFAEFYSVYDGDYDDAWDDYMIYGGLPQIVSFQSERQKADLCAVTKPGIRLILPDSSDCKMPLGKDDDHVNDQIRQRNIGRNPCKIVK